MKIVITGTSGLVGHDLWPALEGKHELWGMGRKKPDFVPLARWRTTDIADAEGTIKAVHQINPDLVIHSAAMSNPDDCEADPDTAYKANSLGTRNLALACQRFDTELLYISTDQVFDGKKGSPYRETDAANPVNHYGISKVWGEHFVQTLLRRYYVVRTALVYGFSRPTFVDRLVESSLSRKSVTAAVDIVNSPTNSKDLAAALAYLIETHVYGLYHLCNEGHCDRYELARFVAESLGRKSDFVKKGSKTKLKLKAPRPGYTPLENFAWNLSGFPRMRSWKEALVSYLQDLPE